MSDQPLALGAILYPGFEMLDLFGPLEMFSMLGQDRVDTLRWRLDQCGLGKN